MPSPRMATQSVLGTCGGRRGRRRRPLCSQPTRELTPLGTSYFSPIRPGVFLKPDSFLPYVTETKRQIGAQAGRLRRLPSLSLSNLKRGIYGKVRKDSVESCFPTSLVASPSIYPRHAVHTLQGVENLSSLVDWKEEDDPGSESDTWNVYLM